MAPFIVGQYGLSWNYLTTFGGNFPHRISTVSVNRRSSLAALCSAGFSMNHRLQIKCSQELLVKVPRIDFIENPPSDIEAETWPWTDKRM